MSLVITVDLAITNIEEIAYAKSVGVDFIVTDHHLPITQEIKTKRGGKSGTLMKQVVIGTDILFRVNHSNSTWHHLFRQPVNFRNAHTHQPVDQER